MHRIALASLFAALALVVGCNASPTTPSDAGTDTGATLDGAADTGTDGGADAAIDANVGVDGGGVDGGDVDAGTSDAGDVDAGTSDAGDVDAGSDAGGTDAGGTDAGSDAGTDAGHDAGSDAGTDGGTDAGTDAGVLTVNGCTAATAEDHTAMSAVTINFGGATGLAYAPRCIRVRAGTTVTFSGSFAFHPLQAGTVSGAVATPAAAGTTPLPTAPVATGTTAGFVMSPVGAYGYYCTVHATFGMNGAIFVE